MSGTNYELRDRIAVVAIDNPPVNGLGHAVRSGIVAGIDRANADPDVDAIVVTGTAKAFSAGADVREFGTPKATAEPTLRNAIGVIEASPKPVVAAIAGACMGGGLELALGCHGRVAARTATIALPEVKLGILPGAGGTQRLPRVVGVETALNMIVTGASVAAGELAGTALFDAVVDGDVVAAALSLLRSRDKTAVFTLVRNRGIDYPDAEAFFQFARNTVGGVAKDLPAPRACVDAVAAAVTMPFEDGLRFEREQFNRLVGTPESRALRHAFFAERAAARIDDLPPGTAPRPVERVAIVGAGTMGTGIAMTFINAGLPVALLEMNAQALDKGVATIRSHYARKLAGDALERNMALLHPTLDYAALADADLVVEAVFEDMAVKRDALAALDKVVKPSTILATNTSTLDVDRLADAVSRPQNVLGMHFFSPAQVMKLLEVVRGERTAPDVLATAMQVAKRIGKIAVVARVCDGFIGNRMIEHYLRQALFLLDEGASPAQVDAALESFGMAMGPFRMSDLAGLDVGWRIRQRRYVERPQVAWSRIADRLYEQGRFGQKTGAGWYRYESGRRDPLPDPAVDALVADYRSEIGRTPRRIATGEIVDRCILALVNEGARVLEEGIAQRASDIDVVYLAGYGFPRHRGGPMFYADTLGLFAVARRMTALAEAPGADREFWTPAPLVARLAAEGGSFNG